MESLSKEEVDMPIVELIKEYFDRADDWGVLRERVGLAAGLPVARLLCVVDGTARAGTAGG